MKVLHKVQLVVIIMVLSCVSESSLENQDNEEMNANIIPEWFEDGKFGMYTQEQGKEFVDLGSYTATKLPGKRQGRTL